MGRLIILAALLLAGCSQIGGGSFCKIASLHTFSDAAVDAMSDEEVNREQAHNEKVASCP